MRNDHTGQHLLNRPCGHLRGTRFAAGRTIMNHICGIRHPDPGRPSLRWPPSSARDKKITGTSTTPGHARHTAEGHGTCSPWPAPVNAANEGAFTAGTRRVLLEERAGRLQIATSLPSTAARTSCQHSSSAGANTAPPSVTGALRGKTSWVFWRRRKSWYGGGRTNSILHSAEAGSSPQVPSHLWGWL